MHKNLYEIFDEFEKANSKEEKLNVLSKNWSETLKLALQLTFNKDIRWKVKDYPKAYKAPDTAPGLSYSNLNLELKRTYVFQAGNPTAEKLTDKRREELLLVLLESLEPREADVLLGIFRKDLGVKGLTYEFVRDNIPGVLPRE